jgi:1,6-anhydro-N-acetylmuramate kinase
MADAKEKLDGVNARLKGLFMAEKQTMMAFNGLTVAATRPGKVSPAIKELTAVAMLAVSVEMAGGPGAVYAAKALEIFDQLG